MNFGDMSVEQQYFHETAWHEVRLAYNCHVQHRKARAQHHVQEALFYAAKVPAEFIEPELSKNIEKIQRLVYRGYE